MSEKQPHFPYVAALLCAACLGAAAWTWMRYSYCWNLSALLLGGASDGPRLAIRAYLGRYVIVRGEARTTPPFLIIDPENTVHVLVSSPEGRVRVLVPEDQFSGPRADDDPEGDWGWGTMRGVMLGRKEYRGRMVEDKWGKRPWTEREDARAVVDASASRLHGASMAGLVVGAMGVFVFTVVLRHWLNRRRAGASEALDLLDEGSAP